MPKQMAKAHICKLCKDCILNFHHTDVTAKVNLKIWKDVVTPNISEELTKSPGLQDHLLSQLDNFVYFCETTSSEIEDHASAGCALFQYVRGRTAPTMRRLAKGHGSSIEKMDYGKPFNSYLEWRGEPQTPEQEKILLMIEPKRVEESSTFCFRWFASPYRPFHALHFKAPESRKGVLSDDWVNIDPFQMIVGPKTAFGKHIPRLISSTPDYPPMLDSIKAKIQLGIKDEAAGLAAENANQSCFMPPRLLEIVKDSSGGLEKVRLVEVDSLKGGASYATLSYCWGGPQEVKLTKKDQPLFARGVSLDLLPQTLKDAVNVTSRLDLSYIWIDALCIIQDDAEDMNCELAVMAQIYQYAAVTIAASRAGSVHEGFLHERRPFRDSSETCFWLQCIQPVKKIGDEYVGELELEFVKVFPVADLEGYRGPEPLEETDGVPTDPLEHRAWTLQERTLSPRVLDFGGLCTHFSVMDITKRAVTSSADGWKGITLSERNLPIFSTESRTNHDMALFEWATIVSHYTSLKLSFLSDRLPGISAFASFLSPALGGAEGYLAGIWQSELPASLLWITHALDRKTVDNVNDLTTRPGPTWSWASLPHQVSYHFESREDRLQADQDAVVIGSHVELQSSKVKFGAVKQGQLRMRGRLRPVRLCLERAADFGFEMYDKTRSEARKSHKRIVLGPERWAEHRGLHRRNYDNPNPHHRDLKLATSVWRDYDDDVTDEIIGDSSELFVLPVASRSSQNVEGHVADAGMSDDMTRLRRRIGLILKRQSGDMYIRVGVFETLDFDPKMLWEDWALKPEEASNWFREQYGWLGEGELQEFTII
ncbi:hypothetical protein HJFPF1_04367 [Paramyrothecium foliicola]|nr:hypothetical protein HJFPF1_04367 [Paramyrothecium foliicola]